MNEVKSLENKGNRTRGHVLNALSLDFPARICFLFKTIFQLVPCYILIKVIECFEIQISIHRIDGKTMLVSAKYVQNLSFRIHGNFNVLTCMTNLIKKYDQEKEELRIFPFSDNVMILLTSHLSHF